MKQFLVVLGAAVVFGVYISVVSGQRGGRPDGTRPIKCYQCNSFYDKGCADFFDNRTYPLKPCLNNATKCRKIVQETYYDGRWDIRYIRQCALEGEVGPDEGRWCKERVGTYRVKIKYCHCDNKDGCNAATSHTLHLFTLGPLLMFISTYLASWLKGN